MYRAVVDRTPAKNTIHGMYVAELRSLMESEGLHDHGLEDIRRFRYYPLRDYMQVLLDCVTSLYPQQPIRDGLQTIGRLVCPTFATSFGGRVIMSAVGSSLELGLKVLARGYQLSLKPGRATTVDLAPGRAKVELRDVWNFGDSYQVGVIEGLMNWCHIEGSITPTVLSPCDTDLLVEWTNS
jgi:uncharacterized protein (TIGR02265 family)